MSVEHAYAEVARITRREARNFAWGIAVLPRPKRLAVAALYAFARRVDDIADDPTLDAEARARGLEGCRAGVAAIPNVPVDDPVLVALSDAVDRYPIPRRALFDLVEGGLMDVEKSRYATWEELREYCRRVAGAVGLACTAVYGPSDPEAAAPRAETLGLALQQINIMRDVAEDWTLGRVYIPQNELSRFRVSEEEIASGRPGPGWRPLMEHQAVRADALLRKGLELLPLLDRRSSLCVRSFAGIYRGLLLQMRSRRYDVFSEPPRLSAVEKMKAVAAL
jgi:phytoene synthase